MTDAAVEGAVIFSDLVGFTEFNGARGDAAAVDVLDRHRTLMDEALAGVDGRVVKELGDGLLVWSPSAGSGVRIATRFLGRLHEAREDHAFPLAVRLGVHHGAVQPRGDDVVGQTVNVAARIVDLAGPGEILLSESVVGAVGEDVPDLQPVGPATVKGVTEPVWLYRVVPNP